MFYWFGWVLEKLNRNVNKAIWLRRGGAGLPKVVKQTYSGDLETEVKYARNKRTVVKPDFAQYRRGNINVQFRNFEDGSVVSFSGVKGFAVLPEELDALSTSQDVRSVLKGGASADLFVLVLVGVLGLVGGLMLGVLFGGQILSAVG